MIFLELRIQCMICETLDSKVLKITESCINGYKKTNQIHFLLKENHNKIEFKLDNMNNLEDKVTEIIIQTIRTLTEESMTTWQIETAENTYKTFYRVSLPSKELATNEKECILNYYKSSKEQIIEKYNKINKIYIENINEIKDVLDEYLNLERFKRTQSIYIIVKLYDNRINVQLIPSLSKSS